MRVTVEMSEQEFMQFLEWRKSQSAPSAKPNQNELDLLPIHELNVRVYSQNILMHHGVLTIRDARRLTDRELLNLPGFGVTSLKELRNAIEWFDSTHKDD